MLHRHLRRDAIVRQDGRSRAFGDQRAALLHKLHQLRQAIDAHAAADVVARVLHAQVRRQRALFVWHRVLPGLRNPIHLRHRRTAHRRIDNHVILRAQIAFAQLLVGKVGVRHAVVVQRSAHPALVLRALPRVHIADPRHRQRMRLHAHARRSIRRQPKLLDGVDDGVMHLRIAAANHKRACAQRVALHLEVVLGGLHLHIGVLEPERRQHVVRRVFDHQRIARALNHAGHHHVLRHQRHRRIQHRLVSHRLHNNVAHQRHRPARIVIRQRVRHGIVLQAEVQVHQRAVRLIGADNVIARRHLHPAKGPLLRRRLHLDALVAQIVHHLRCVHAVELRCGDDPTKRGAVLALLHAALVLQPVVFQIQALLRRHLVQRQQDRRLLNVGVRARAPLDRRQRRVGPVPLAAGRGRRQLQVVVLVRPVALHLIEPPKRVVRLRNPEQVVRHPAVVVAIGKDARHAALGHLHDLGLGQHPPLVDGDGIERRVVRPRTGRHIQVRLRLMQVVQDRRVPLQHAARDVLRQVQQLPHAVAVVVMRHVLAPVHQRRLLLLGRLAVVVGVHLLVATVGLHHRRDEDDRVVADLLDERCVLHDQPVGQLHQHLRPARLRRMDAGRNPVDRLRRMDDLLRLLLGGLARVSQRRQVGLVLVEALHRLLAADGEHHHVAALFALERQLPELRARRVLRQLLVVLVDLRHVVQLARLPRHRPQRLQRGGHLRRRRQMVHQLR